MHLTRILAICFFLSSTASCNAVARTGWFPLFDGVSLEGWRASESPDTFFVSDGAIIAHGPRAHLFYVGPVAAHEWKDFELAMEVMTSPGANSGIYFHTQFQDLGFPEVGYQVQINNTNPYPSFTGGLYGVDDRKSTPVKDNEWFTVLIRVEGKRIITEIDGHVICDYLEPEDPERKDDVTGSIIGKGTFALQGHDEDSEIRFRNIRVRSLTPAERRPN